MQRIAILTAGHIHMPGFVKRIKARTDVQVVGVWDPNAALAAKVAAELGAPVAASAGVILGDPTIHAVVISGTTGQHDTLAAAAARAGKHTFIEKPLATTAAEANRIFTAFKESPVLFQTGHFMRCDPLNRFIKQEIDAGNLGTITRARHSNCHHGAMAGWFDTDYRWFRNKDEAGGGGFYDLGCHSVDVLVYFFGAIETVTAAIAPKTIKYPQIDEYGEGLMRFKNGVIATVTGSWVDIANPVTCLITGTEGHLHVVGGQLFYTSKKSSVPGADGKQPIDKAHFPAALPHAFDLFFDVLAGTQDKSQLIPIEDALNVARAMDAMYQAERLGQWVKV